MLAPYPTAQPGCSQPELDSRYEQAQAVVAAIRKLRSGDVVALGAVQLRVVGG